MSNKLITDRESLWARHNAVWRSTAQIASQWQDAGDIDHALLKYTIKGNWWHTLEAAKITLLISREYEHLLIGMTVKDGAPHINYMPMPHPSGIAVDRRRSVVHIASTRNPNQIYDLAPVSELSERLDVESESIDGQPLIPIRSRFLPGCLYMHDISLIGEELFANAVGHNAVVKLNDDGSYQRVWWPKCIDTKTGPAFGQNYIQLNSIAAGPTLRESFFSASSDKIGRLRPGHPDYQVDKRGVIFSGQTREVIATGLTRPHSARTRMNGKKREIWVDNSGYGEFGLIQDNRFEPLIKLPGWTRGLAFVDNIAFVGTSCVIPKFRQYAPGLDVKTSICGIHAIDLKSGKVLGSISWPLGNQIFAIDWISNEKTIGFPFAVTSKNNENNNGDRRTLFYSFNAFASSGNGNGKAHKTKFKAKSKKNK